MKILPTAFPLFALLLLSTTGVGATTPKKPEIKITGTFSDIDISEETDDIVGTEITIIHGGRNYWVIYQEAEGEPGEPKLVKAKVSGTSIEFTVSGLPGKSRIFKGQITRTALSGSLVGLNPSIKLIRKKSFWQ